MSAAAARASTSPAPGCARPAGKAREFHLIGPLRDDLPAEIEAVWHPIRPGTDVALMLGMAHTLVTEGLHDRAFLDRYCVGYEIFEAYLLGRSDGQPKDAALGGRDLRHCRPRRSPGWRGAPPAGAR